MLTSKSDFYLHRGNVLCFLVDRRPSLKIELLMVAQIITNHTLSHCRSLLRPLNRHTLSCTDQGEYCLIFCVLMATNVTDWTTSASWFSTLRLDLKLIRGLSKRKPGPKTAPLPLFFHKITSKIYKNRTLKRKKKACW